MAEKKGATKKVSSTQEAGAEGVIKTKDELKTFLLSIRDKMTEQVAAPVYAVSAMNSVLNTPGVDKLLNKENKEIARDIWLRVRQSGFQVRNPSLLFSSEEEATIAPG
jgi:hypothetical protein